MISSIKTPCLRKTPARRGSTLVIVIALLGLLAFMGVLFFTFAAQEKVSAEYFSDTAKSTSDDTTDVFAFAIEQLISGADESHAHSALYSPTRRHSLLKNMVGSDVHPFTGGGVSVIYEGGIPSVDLNRNGTGTDEDGGPSEYDTQELLEFADSPAFRDGAMRRSIPTPSGVPYRYAPEPDVPYTYPDINHLFLAYKGFAIRDNGVSVTPRFEQVPVIIPSFFRPQYMKSIVPNGLGGTNVPTDFDWAADAADTTPSTAPLRTRNFMGRSLRPHALHRRYDRNGNWVYRYLTDAQATALGVASGGFPFLPDDVTGGIAGNRGELGVWTGSNPNVFEGDVDNDGDSIKEGMWLDLDFPIQEYTDGSGNTRLYVVLHSFTVYDLDGLIDVNTHGNLAFLPRGGSLPAYGTSGLFDRGFVSASNLGLGPNEINPLWALRRDDRDFSASGPLPPYAGNLSAYQSAQFNKHFGGVIPSNSVEQSNMEWLWLLAGRGDYDETSGALNDVLPGRWGEAERLYYALNNGLVVGDLPRPGQFGNAQATVSTGINFGGRGGYDDNQNTLDGEPLAAAGRLRPFGHPMDFQGSGRSQAMDYPQLDLTSSTQAFTFSRIPGTTDQHAFDDPRTPLLRNLNPAAGPSRWFGYEGYSSSSAMDTSLKRYMFGPNGIWDGGTGDDLSAGVFADASFEDPLETIFYSEFAQRPVDQIYSAEDLLALHLESGDLSAVSKNISLRLQKLAPYSFAAASNSRKNFTTLSNALRFFPMRSPFGSDNRPGAAGIDDDADGSIDEPDEVLAGADPTEDPSRFWEFNSDFDGDGNLEFPPRFGGSGGAISLYGPTDPFRPQVRRLLAIEAGENRSLIGQLPISLNHLLDVERNNQTPAEGTSQFLSLMQKSGLRFRPLTEHPDGNVATTAAATRTYTIDPVSPDPAQYTVLNESAVAFPPKTIEEREFWARRDRQKLARDIYVLLYTLGGAHQAAGAVSVSNYTLDNDPNLTPADPGFLYSHARLRQMAQFAVNLVDAMDSDNVITRFEYDKDLGDGWNLDDDPYTSHSSESASGPSSNSTANGMYPEDTDDRGIVYGVEAQQLAFSEVLGIRSAITTDSDSDGTTDHPATPHDDTNGRDHLFIELQNILPYDPSTATAGAPKSGVALASTATTNDKTAVWRIVRRDREAAGGVDPYSTPNGHRTLYFLSNNDVVPVDGRFTIATANNAEVISSDFYVDYNLDATYDLIAPNVPAGTLPTTTTNKTDPNAPEYKPYSDLDLIHPDDSVGRFGMLDESGVVATAAAPGYFLQDLKVYSGHADGMPLQKFNDLNYGQSRFSGEYGFDLVLQRRANPEMPSLANSAAQSSAVVADMNPWVDVDRISVAFQDFQIKDNSTASELQDNQRLLALSSDERAEPLSDTSRGLYPITPVPANFRLNSIGSLINELTDRASDVTALGAIVIPGTNDGTGVFKLAQQHFDREYASPGELLNLMTVGPHVLTQRLNESRFSGYQQVGTTPDPDLICSAAAMILMPDFPNTAGATLQDNTSNDNRWYRLLQFAEVPARTHRMLGNYLTQTRVPGKMNINMIRYREVYAGLIDNPMFADAPFLVDRTPGWGGGGLGPKNGFSDGPFLIDSTPGIPADEADRWIKLLRDRDGEPVLSFDPVAGVAKGFFIPGTPNAQPFRDGQARAEVAVDFNGDGIIDRIESGIDDTLLRRGRLDADEDGDGVADDGVGSGVTGVPMPQRGTSADIATLNRESMEIGSPTFHISPDSQVDGLVYGSGNAQRHQVLTKILNNTTTVSNTFIVHVSAGYFEAYEDPVTKLIRVGGQFDLDGDGDPKNDQQRAVYVIDRTEAFRAYNSGTGDFDWQRLIKHRSTIK